MVPHHNIVIVFCLIANALISQTITRYSYNQGLTDENIIYINQDYSGNLWLCSDDGSITSFNGWEFKDLEFSKPVDTDFKKIICITVIDGDILIATNNGVVLLREASYIKLYQGRVLSAYVINNALYFIGEQNKLNKIVNTTVSETNPERIESSLVLGNKLLLLLESKQLFELTQDESLQLVHDFNQSEILSYLNYTIQLTEGRLSFSLTDFNLRSNGVGAKEVEQFIQDAERSWLLADGELWLLENEEIRNLSKTPNLSGSEVNYIFRDYEDNIWAGTTNGLFKIHMNKFRYAGSIQSRDRITTISAAWSNQLVMGTEHGKLYTVENKKITGERILKNVSNETINGSYFDQHDKLLLLSTEFNGLLKIDAGNNIEKLLNRNTNGAATFLQVFEDKKNGWWASSRNQIIKISPQVIDPLLQLNVLPDRSILDAFQNQISIVALSNTGIHIIEGEHILHDSIQKVNFGNKILTCFEIDKYGRFWIGTWGHGVILIDQDRKTQRTISRLDGLNSDIIFNLIDIDKNVYVGTPGGIDLISFINGGIKVRHLSDEITPTNQNTFFYDTATQLLWFGSNSRGYYYQVGTEFNKPPIVTIDEIIFYGPRLNDTTFVEVQKKEIAQLKYNTNNVEFKFLGISLSYPEAVTYSTRLMGWNSNWTNPTSVNHIRFNNLQPGSYKFEVLAFSPEGIPSSQTESVEFIINNPVWAEPGLILSGIFLLFISGWIVLVFVERKKVKIALSRETQKQEVIDQVRKNIASDFHDNIGNKLAGLKLASNLMRTKLEGENKEVSELLAEIEKSSQDIFDGTKDFIWSIDPESDNLIEVFTYLKDFGERFFERTRFTFYSHLISNTNAFVKIPTGWSRQMVMIFKEAMTNTFKHSRGNTVTLQLDIKANQFDFSYCDNGGYDGAKRYSGRGMKNMVDRASSINCQLNYFFTDSRVEVILLGSLNNS